MDEAAAVILKTAVEKISPHSGNLQEALYFLSISRNGLRIRDLQKLIKNQTVALQFLDIIFKKDMCKDDLHKLFQNKEEAFSALDFTILMNEEALCYYEKDINCGEALCEQRRSRMGLCQLLFGYRKRGDILSALGRITQALECRKKAVDIIKEIYESSSSEYDVARYIECLMELSYCLHQLGRIEEAEEYEALARELEGRLS